MRTNFNKYLINYTINNNTAYIAIYNKPDIDDIPVILNTQYNASQTRIL